MALLADITAGTVSVSAGGTVVTGSGTPWQVAGFREGDIFIASGYWAVVDSVDSNTELSLVDWAGPELTDAPYRLRYMSDGSRASAQARQLIDMLGGSGSLEALASLTGAPGTIPMFTGPGVMELVAKTDLLNGLAYDVQVNVLEDRDAYDNEQAGFAVLVSDVGDGRSAVYSRTGEAGNWSDPAYITGPAGEAGPFTNITFGPVTTVPSNVPASSEVVQIDPDTIRVDLSIPKGADGTGTGDVIGPDGATDGEIALMDGPTGGKIKGSGKGINDLLPADKSITNAKLADMATARVKGRATAGTGAPEDLTAAQVMAMLSAAPATRATIGGTANAITLTSPVVLATGCLVRFRATAANTGAATIALNGESAIACRTIAGVALPAGYVRTDVDTTAVYDGTYWVLGREDESGSNSNGNYLRLADGTQVTTANVSLGSRIFAGAGTLADPYRTNIVDHTFPAAFIATPTPALSALCSAVASARIQCPSYTSITNAGISAMQAGSITSANTAGDVTMSVTATGRWY